MPSAGEISSSDPAKSYDGFISYRRIGGSELTALVKDRLERDHGLKLFLDVDSLRSGTFNERLLLAIQNSSCFILILSKGALKSCRNEGDWLRREIAEAIKNNKAIIPIFAEGVKPPKPESLPEIIRAMPWHNGIPYFHGYRDAVFNKMALLLRQRILPQRPALLI
jgi:hypothetical protein